MRSVILTMSLLFVSALQDPAGHADSAPTAQDARATSQPTTGIATSQPAIELNLDAEFSGFDACFVLLDLTTGEISRYNAARCATPFSPCSTFKIPNAIIGLETGVLDGPDHLMRWDGTRHRRSACNQDQTLRTAVRDSVVWYFQRIATAVGEARMKEWLETFEYGNRDMSDGLTTFWLGTSLKISADGQVAFLAKLRRGEFPVSIKTRDDLNDMLHYTNSDGCVIRGKTGSLADATRSRAILGWYVGFVEFGDRHFIFACNISAESGASGARAQEISVKVLRSLVPHQHKRVTSK